MDDYDTTGSTFKWYKLKYKCSCTLKSHKTTCVQQPHTCPYTCMSPRHSHQNQNVLWVRTFKGRGRVYCNRKNCRCSGCTTGRGSVSFWTTPQEGAGSGPGCSQDLHVLGSINNTLLSSNALGALGWEALRCQALPYTSSWMPSHAYVYNSKYLYLYHQYSVTLAAIVEVRAPLNESDNIQYPGLLLGQLIIFSFILKF